MSQRNKLRKILRDHFDEQEFTIGPNEWERASAQLNDTRNKRKLRYILFLMPALLITAFIANLFIQLPKETQSDLSSLEKQNTVPILKTKSVLKLTKKQTSSENTTFVNSKHFRESTTPTQRHEKSKPIRSDIHPVNGISMTKIPTSPILNEQPPNIGVTTPTPGHAGLTEEADKSKDNLETNLSGHDLITQQQTQSPVENEMVKTNTVTSVEKIEAAHLVGLEAQNKIDSVPQNISAEKTTANYFTAIPNPSMVDTAATQTDSLALKTTSLAQPTQQLSNEGIYYEAGGAWLYGWTMDGQKEARGLSPVVGVNYQNTLGNRFDLSFGIQYYQVPNLSLSGKTSRVSSYTYGEQSKVTVITPTTLHYLVLPFRVRYHNTDKQSFGAGINLGYLLNVDATVSTYDEQPGFTTNYETEKLSGYMRGFSWYDIQLAAFYRRRIFSTLDVQGEVFFGVTDVKQNEFFGTSGFQRNSGAKFTLIYYAFRKHSR